jgi:hypothetical protein
MEHEDPYLHLHVSCNDNAAIHGGWTHGGFPIGGRDPLGFSRSLATMHTALRGDMYRQTSRACSRAFLAGLLFGSDMSLTVCAITFLSRRSLVGSRKASASRIGSDTAFHARRISLAPSLWTFSSAWVSLTTPGFPGPYHADTA